MGSRTVSTPSHIDRRAQIPTWNLYLGFVQMFVVHIFVHRQQRLNIGLNNPRICGHWKKSPLWQKLTFLSEFVLCKHPPDWTQILDSTVWRDNRVKRARSACGNNVQMYTWHVKAELLTHLLYRLHITYYVKNSRFGLCLPQQWLCSDVITHRENQPISSSEQPCQSPQSYLILSVFNQICNTVLISRIIQVRIFENPY